MTTPIVLYGAFIASKVGKTGLSPTVNVRSIERSTGTVTSVASGASAFTVGDGVYGYQVSNATPQTHDYLAVFITSDATVDAQHVQAVWPPLAGAWAVELAAVLTRLAASAYTAPLDATATQAAAAAALTAYDPATGAEVAALPDNLLDNEEVSAGVTVRQSLAASGGAANPWTTDLLADDYIPPQAGYYMRRLANNEVQLVAVFDPETQSLRYYYGDDYTAAESRQQTFTTALDLTNASVKWIVYGSAGIHLVDCSIVDSHTYALAPLATDLADIGVGTWRYDLEIKLANTHTVTEISGMVTIRSDVR